ncbi:MAG: hypothetical protein Q9184_002780 [Pyrenodesmia sp. 2 TL-2023]
MVSKKRRSSATVGQAPIHMSQAFTHFFRLPLELRQQVYRSYFSTLNLTYPHMGFSPLFLSSRQLYSEASPFYWENAKLNFKGTKQLVDFLTSINHETLCKLRHIAVRGFPFPLYRDTEAFGYTTYNFEHVLPLFPGLQLSTLWLGDPFHGKWSAEDGWGHNAAYSAVDELIKSQGFKELTYVVENDRFLMPVRFESHDSWSATNTTDSTSGTHEPEPRHPQPSTWDSMMKERDGPSASVKMYRLLDGNRRIPLETEFETIKEAIGKGDEGQIEVSIKRGTNADHVQKGEPVNEWAEGLLDLFKDLSWKEIKEKELYVEAEACPTAHL